MKIQLRFFASLRESLGVSQESIDVPASIQTLGELRAHLRERGGEWAVSLAEGRALRMAFNHELAMPNTRLTEGAEVAFFPPVTGG